MTLLDWLELFGVISAAICAGSYTAWKLVSSDDCPACKDREAAIAKSFLAPDCIYPRCGRIHEKKNHEIIGGL